MYLFFRKLLSIFFHIKYKINIINEQNIPDLKGGYIIASNHQSNWDPPMIAAVVRGKFSFMAKEELFHINPFAVWIMKACGAFPVVRGAGDDAPILTSIEKLKQNRILVIFPEGTRSKDGTIGRVKSGVTLIASQAGVPVLPICIRYGDKRRVDVNFGKLIPAEEMYFDMENDRKKMREISKRLQDELVSLQQEIFNADSN